MWKAGAITAIAAALGGATYWQVSTPATDAAPNQTVPAEPVAKAVAQVPEAKSEPSTAEEESEDEQVTEAEALPEPTPSIAQHAPTNAEKAPKSDLEQEVKLLRGAQQALNSGDAPGALRLLNEHAKRYPRGALAGERAATQAVALCASGNQASGRAAAERFLKAQPGSPMASRLRSACGL
jgi:type IV secretory pathway VirB10-like protein